MNEIVIRAAALAKTYARGTNELHALNGIYLTVARGQLIAITGTTASCNATLMNLLGCLDTPTSGAYLLDGVRVEYKDGFGLARASNTTPVTRSPSRSTVWPRTPRTSDTCALAAATDPFSSPSSRSGLTMRATATSLLPWNCRWT